MGSRGGTRDTFLVLLFNTVTFTIPIVLMSFVGPYPWSPLFPLKVVNFTTDLLSVLLPLVQVRRQTKPYVQILKCYHLE